MTGLGGQVDLDEGLLETVDRVASAADSWHQIAWSLRQELAETDDATALIAAFEYSLHIERRSVKRPSRASFEPMLRFGDGETSPPLVASVPERWVTVWAAAAASIRAPAGVARLHDLLVVRGVDDRRPNAESAAAAYRTVARLAGWSHLDQADALVRALELARSFRLDALIAPILDEMVAAARASLQRGPAEPGVALCLIRALASDSDGPEVVDALLAQARSAYRGAHHAESVIEIQLERARGNRTQIVELQRSRVRAWLDEADRTEGLASVVHLETAARLARDLGFSDLATEAATRLQAVGPESLDLARISVEATIPEAAVREYLAPLLEASDVRDLLATLVSYPPSTGSASENRDELAKSRVEFPLQHMFSQVRLGGDGLPRWTPNTEEQTDDGALSRQELLRFRFTGDLIATGLYEGGRALSPTESEVAQFLEELPNIDADPAALLAHAFAAYWRGDWTAALFMALPCAETFCRQVVISLGRGIYQTQRGQRPGQYPGLGSLLQWMRESGLDEDWYRYAWTVLASPAGLNLRNEVAHGFVHSVAPLHAAAVLQIVLYLGAIGTSEDTRPPDDKPTEEQGPSV